MNNKKKRIRQEKAIKRLELQKEVYEGLSIASQKALDNTKAKLK